MATFMTIFRKGYSEIAELDNKEIENHNQNHYQSVIGVTA